MKTTLKSIGLFALITSAVAAGVLTAGRISEVRHDIQRGQAMTRAACADAALETSGYFDAIKSKCKEIN